MLSSRCFSPGKCFSGSIFLWPRGKPFFLLHLCARPARAPYMGQAGRGPRGKKFGLVENHTSVLRIDVVFPLPPTLCHEDASTRRHREGPRFLEAPAGARGLLEHGGGAHKVRAELQNGFFGSARKKTELKLEVRRGCEKKPNPSPKRAARATRMLGREIHGSCGYASVCPRRLSSGRARLVARERFSLPT